MKRKQFSEEQIIGLMIGHYEMDVYGDAERSRERAITVDFMHGAVIEDEPSASLVESVALYRTAFADLCSKAGGSIADVIETKARFLSNALNRHFTVTITDHNGRHSATDYAGILGQRVKMLDPLGRLRPRSSSGLRITVDRI